MSEEKNTNQDNSNELSLDDLEAVAGGTDPVQKCHDAREKQGKPADHPHQGLPHLKRSHTI